MSNNAMEQYFENLQREKNQALWKKTSEEIGTPEPEVVTFPPAADDSATDRADHADLGPVWNKFNEQIGGSFLNRNC